MRFCTKLFILFIGMHSVIFTQQIAKHRVMAVTFDDLPMVRAEGNTEMRLITEKILHAVKEHGIPVIGFVNTKKLETNEVLDPEKEEILSLWLKQGYALGNHTYSHPSFHTVPPDSFFKNVLRGEIPLRSLIEKNGSRLEYFRHPFLQTGRSVALRDSLHQFLFEHGYTIAPVTIDNAEWIFALAYDNLNKQNDSLAAKKIAAAYIEYMCRKLEYFETCSERLFGRNIDHILLVHANRLNADYFSALAAAFEQAGYTFSSLEKVLMDPAYKSKDTFTGGGGISWLHRWAKTRGEGREFFKDEPECPAFVMQAAGVDSE